MAKTALCGWNDGPAGSGRDLLVSQGPTIGVSIGFDPAYNPALGQPPNHTTGNLHALVDTGATECCIDALLASQLGLPIIDRRPISGAHGSQEVNVYLAQIYVQGPLDFTVYGAFCGVDLVAGGQPHHALIGRTFLSHLIMEYNGLTGTVVLTIP